MLNALVNTGHDVTLIGRDLEWTVIIDDDAPITDCTLSSAVETAFKRHSDT